MSTEETHQEKFERVPSENGGSDNIEHEKNTVNHEEDVPKSSPFDGYVPETAPRYSAEEEAKVIRKLDWNVIPLLFLLYTLSVLDRTNLGNAKIAGLQDDIDIEGIRYNWLGTIFYISCKRILKRCS